MGAREHARTAPASVLRFLAHLGCALECNHNLGIQRHERVVGVAAQGRALICSGGIEGPAGRGLRQGAAFGKLGGSMPSSACTLPARRCLSPCTPQPTYCVLDDERQQQHAIDVANVERLTAHLRPQQAGQGRHRAGLLAQGLKGIAQHARYAVGIPPSAKSSTCTCAPTRSRRRPLSCRACVPNRAAGRTSWQAAQPPAVHAAPATAQQAHRDALPLCRHAPLAPRVHECLDLRVHHLSGKRGKIGRRVGFHHKWLGVGAMGWVASGPTRALRPWSWGPPPGVDGESVGKAMPITQAFPSSR